MKRNFQMDLLRAIGMFAIMCEHFGSNFLEWGG